MKNSLIIVGFLILGIATSYYGLLPEVITKTDYSKYALYILLVLVGISTGIDEHAMDILKSSPLKMLFVPLATIIGTLTGVALVSFFIDQINLKEALAVGSGFGYYSLSGILIAKVHSDKLGMVAMLSNILREVTTLLLTPIFAKYFGKFAPISAGGATSMDTTLPIITEYSGSNYVIVSVFHGLILTILVPLLVMFFLNI